MRSPRNMESRLKAREVRLGRVLPEREIIELYRSGDYSMQMLAEKYDVDRHSTIRRILSRPCSQINRGSPVRVTLHGPHT